MRRIVIIGVMGSGKSTFTNKLGILLKRPVIHLDREYFLPGWKEKYSKEGWEDFQKELIKKDEWIIDGNYKRTIDLRIEAADTIIFFDFPKWVCVFRVFKRVFDHTPLFDKPEGTKQKVSFGLLKFIITYPKKSMRNKLKSYKNSKKVFIVRNSSEVEALLKDISAKSLA